jgi:hypothetical protein
VDRNLPDSNAAPTLLRSRAFGAWREVTCV